MQQKQCNLTLVNVTTTTTVAAAVSFSRPDNDKVRWMVYSTLLKSSHDADKRVKGQKKEEREIIGGDELCLSMLVLVFSLSPHFPWMRCHQSPS